MLKDELEAVIRSDNVWAGRSTLVLAVGILGEYVLLPFLEETHHWKKWAKVACAVLVVAGIVGEYGFSSRIAQNAGRLQTMADQDLAEAVDNAAKANERAALNEKEAARLNKLAEDERTARVAIEQCLGGWRLTPDAQRRIAKKLKPFAGTVFDIRVNPAELRLMETLDTLLTSPSVGWIRQRPKAPNGEPMQALIGNAGVYLAAGGITVGVAHVEWDVFKDAFTTLLKALRAEGIPAKGEVFETGDDPDAVHITIGRRE